MRGRAAAVACALLFAGCTGSAGEADAETRLPVRIVTNTGIEWPRDSANDLRYALALVPGGLFGAADRATLRQLAPEKAHLVVVAADLEAWAAAGAKTWQVGGEPVTVAPADARIARVMLAAFAGEGGSNFGVSLHDLGTRRNSVFVYVDRACSVRSDANAAAGGSGVTYALEFPRAGFYWVRTAPGEAIATVDPDVLTVEVRLGGA